MTDEARREADLPAEQACAEAPARVSRAHGQRRRPQSAGAAPGQRPQALVGLNASQTSQNGSCDALARLKRRAQFLFVRQGARAARPCVIVEARRRAPVDAAGGGIGVGFTASRKVGGAVARNRAKRRLREAARRLLPGLGLAGVDYVLVARATTVNAAWASLLDDVGNALIRLRAELQTSAGGPQRPARKRARAKGGAPTESD